MEITRHPRLYIDTSTIVANWKKIDALTQEAETAAVVKSDSYGLGAVEVTQALIEAGCKTFFTASISDSCAILENISKKQDFILSALNGFTTEDLSIFRAHSNLVPVLNSLLQFQIWQECQDLHDRGAFIHVDTGMNRLGLRWEEWQALAPTIHFPVRAVMSHLVCADMPDHPMNKKQCDALLSINAYPLSLANSAGCFLGRRYHAQLVRPGIALYGGSPFHEPQNLGLRSCLSLDAPILQIRRLSAGETIGYNATYTATEDCSVAILGIGYNEGIPRNLNPHDFCAWYDGTPLPICGRISMDSMAIRIPDQIDLHENMPISLLGKMQTIDDLAKACNTIPHEALTRLGGRIVRFYQTIDAEQF